MDKMDQLKRGIRLELNYLHGGEATYLPGQSLPHRMLADFELVFMIEGTVIYCSDGEPYEVPPGAFIIGRPEFQESYRWDPSHPTRHAFFHFGIDRIPADWPATASWPRVCQEAPPFCASVFMHVLQHMYERPGGAAMQPTRSECRLVEALLDTLIEERHDTIQSFERERPEPVRRALQHIRQLAEEQPEKALTLQELATHSGTTAKHLCRLFSRFVGTAPMQTYSLIKLESARLLLMRTNLSIKEISAQVGVENPLYFSRCFSKEFGCSPKAFRTKLRQGIVTAMRHPLPIDLVPRGRI